ncbi:hypothetical protein ElyMa_002709600 [Elysia marginata]|uniref:Uncharacterized protein n=1 Tax=Elysia marginata TaxID=1093978 RepID=A0AAV4HCW0_9GAST|nr:hypothetical protein ElyMa_002709600 [Elysia marginata]
MASSNNDDILSLHEECDAALVEEGGEKPKEQTDILSPLQEQTLLLAKILEAQGRGHPPHSSGKIVSSAAELENELCNVASDASEEFTQPPASDDVFATAEAELLSSDEVGPPLMEKLGTFVTNCLSKKLDETVLKKKLSEQKRPSNCPSLSAPLTNPLIWQVLRAPYKRNDTRLTNAQINISKAATAVALAVEHLHDLKDQQPSLQKSLALCWMLSLCWVIPTST